MEKDKYNIIGKTIKSCKFTCKGLYEVMTIYFTDGTSVDLCGGGADNYGDYILFFNNENMLPDFDFQPQNIS